MVRIFTRNAAFAVAFTVSGCGAKDALPAGDAPLEPIAFFAGQTHGEGRLNKLFSRSVNVSVDSVGRTQGDMLILDQTIREGLKRTRTREWTMRPVGSNHYSGTLTDAVGPVEISVQGPRAIIRYRMRNGLKVEQRLALQADRKSVLNRLDVQKFGARLATLNETIRKLN